MLNSIPSPSASGFSLGPLTINVYGLMIALGVLAAVWLGRRRLAAAGHDPEFISDLALWVVPAGLIGTRMYHVATDWERLYSDGRWPDAFKIWNGGLGIPGGILAGVVVGVWYIKRRGVDLPMMMDVCAPCVPLAQAIGRFGNYFNQELFGRPTTLPRALEITKPGQLAEAQAKYPGATTFHPTFLYESLWNVGLVLVLLAIGRRNVWRRGKLLPAYVAGYFLGRMWVEELRIDTAARVFGDLRWNFVLSVAMVVIGLIWLSWGGLRSSPEERAARAAVRPWVKPTDDTSIEGASVDGPPDDEAQTDEVSGDEPVTDLSESAGEVEEQLAQSGPEFDGPRTEAPVTEPDRGDAH